MPNISEKTSPISGALTPEKTNLSTRIIDRDITKLALPSLGTLLVQPLLVLVDSTMIGRIGTSELAGLSLASTILSTVIGLCIFLSYATTATTAHFVGAGKIAAALRSGIDGIWIALLLGLSLGVGMNLFSEKIIGLFSPSAETLTHGSQYLVASSFGIPGMLLVLAATGTIRGFADTKTPLYVATFGALLNIPLNTALIYGAKLGVYGAGLGTAIAETLMALLLVGKILQLRKDSSQKTGETSTDGSDSLTHISLLPTGAGLLRSLKDAFPLFLRTVSLRGALLLQIMAATSLGTVALASNQIIMALWNFAAYGLDALATSAQILVGQGLGQRNKPLVKLVVSRCLKWGFWFGIFVGVGFLLISLFVPNLMSTDDAVRALSTQILWICGVLLPIAAITYMLDGILIGAGDSQKLAVYMFYSLLTFLPLALAIIYFSPMLTSLGMHLLWIAYGLAFMGVRAGTMLWRVRGETWMNQKEI